jgi:hypothetical protein
MTKLDSRQRHAAREGKDWTGQRFGESDPTIIEDRGSEGL